MKFDPGAFKLLDCLDEISGIGPETSVVEGNDHIPGLSGKATDPLDLFPPFSRIFTAMRVRACDNDCVNTFFSHDVTDHPNP